MDETLQRALREAERAGYKLVLAPPDPVLALMQVLASGLPFTNGAPLWLSVRENMIKLGANSPADLVNSVRKWLVGIGAAKPNDWDNIDRLVKDTQELTQELFGPLVSTPRPDLPMDPARALRLLRRLQDLMNEEAPAEEARP